MGRARQLGRRRAGTERGGGHLLTPFAGAVVPQAGCRVDKFIPVCRPPQHPSPRPQKKAPPGNKPQGAPPPPARCPNAQTGRRSLQIAKHSLGGEKVILSGVLQVLGESVDGSGIASGALRAWCRCSWCIALDAGVLCMGARARGSSGVMDASGVHPFEGVRPSELVGEGDGVLVLGITLPEAMRMN